MRRHHERRGRVLGPQQRRRAGRRRLREPPNAAASDSRGDAVTTRSMTRLPRFAPIASRIGAFALGAASLASMFGATARAQRAMTVSGYVSAAGLPIGGASVSIATLGVGAISDHAGRYSFIVTASLVYGQTLTISARHRGYETETTSVTLNGTPVVQDFELHAPKRSADVTDPILS